MGKLYAIGESLIDLIFRDNKPVAAMPGGSSLNTCITLGRLGAPVYFISEYGYDPAGEIIHSFLADNHVRCDHVSRFRNGQTAIALAFLDRENNARYSFYKNYPAQRLPVEIPDFHPGDILLFGSFYALTGEVRPALTQILHKARDQGATILYDPNIRQSHKDDLNALRPFIRENISFADLIRGSDEDFLHIFGSRNPQESFNAVGNNHKILIYTASSNGVTFISAKGSRVYRVPSITPVSTIGAGDSFNAGIAYNLHREGCTGHPLDYDLCFWDRAIEQSITLATQVCLSYENYISREVAGKMMEQ